MMEKDWRATILAEARALEKQRAHDWPLALDRLHVTFEADHGGGYPPCLAEGTPESRLAYLRELGFRVRERFEVEGAQWVRLTCGISVCLSDGWVHRTPKG